MIPIVWLPVGLSPRLRGLFLHPGQPTAERRQAPARAGLFPRAGGQGRAGCSQSAGDGAVRLCGAGGAPRCARGSVLGGAGCSALDRGWVVGEPGVAGPEGLKPGCLSVPHDAQAVAVGLEAHDAVVLDPEPTSSGCRRSRSGS